MPRVVPAVLPGEEELGPQVCCQRCGDWYPADAEFWFLRPDGRVVRPCRACTTERQVRQRGYGPRRPAAEGSRWSGLTPEQRAREAARRREWRARRRGEAA